MAFIRAKKIKGHTYYYRVESYVENGKIRQKILKYLGKEIPEEYLHEYRKRGPRVSSPKTEIPLGWPPLFLGRRRGSAMAVRKLGKYYQIDYYVGRKRIREVLKGVTTKREADEIERERLRNSTGPIEFKRFEALAHWFLTHPDKESKKTLDKDRQRFENHLLPYFGHCKPHDINSSMVDDYKVRRQRQFAANATINRELALLKSIFRFGLKKGKVFRVPPIDLLSEDNVRQRFITEKEFEKICSFLPVDVLSVVMIAYHTAMRLGEILGLRWRNVDLKKHLFVFETEKTGRQRRQRAVALHPEIIRLFESMPRGFGETPVFNLKPYRIQGAWRRACKKAKVKDARVHDLRRTRATIWHKEKELPQDLIMHMTGHRTDSMFRRYQIVSTEYVEKLAQKWSDDDKKEDQDSR